MASPDWDYPLWSAVPTHLVNCRSLVSMLRWRMHMRVSAEPMSRVAPGKEASCMGRGLAGGPLQSRLQATRRRAIPQRLPLPRPHYQQSCSHRDMGAS